MTPTVVNSLAADLDLVLTCTGEEARRYEFLAALRNRGMSCRPFGLTWSVVSRSGQVWASARD